MKFWALKDEIPTHIIRYEDIMEDPEPVLKKLIEFVLNVKDITGTKAGRYVELAVREKRPQNYKPREGKVNANSERYSEDL